MAIRPLHQLTFNFNTFHTSLVTVILPVNCYTSSIPLSSCHDHHTSPPNYKPPEDCHTSWQLSHLPTPLYTSPITITPLHQLTHFSYTFHTSLNNVPYTSPITITPLHQLTHLLSTVTPPHTPLHLPHDHHTSISTDTPFLYIHASLITVTLSENCHTYPRLLTSPQWPSHLPINWPIILIPFTSPLGLSHSLSTVTLSSWQSCIPYHVQELSHFPNSFHTFPMALTFPSWPSYHLDHIS